MLPSLLWTWVALFAFPDQASSGRLSIELSFIAQPAAVRERESLPYGQFFLAGGSSPDKVPVVGQVLATLQVSVEPGKHFATGARIGETTFQLEGLVSELASGAYQVEVEPGMAREVHTPGTAPGRDLWRTHTDIQMKAGEWLLLGGVGTVNGTRQAVLLRLHRGPAEQPPAPSVGKGPSTGCHRKE